MSTKAGQLQIAVLMALLLGSADPVFASFFAVNLDLSQAALDALYAAAGAVAMAGLLRLGAAREVERLAGPRWRLGLTEGLIVVGILDGVFGAFAIAQAVAASGNGTQALHDAGTTYADYARSGFFQLLWVAGITLVLLIVFSRIIERPQGRTAMAFRALTCGAFALTLLIVLVSFQRLSLYEQAYGFTMLRLYSHIFAVWIGIVFLLLAADSLGVVSSRKWLLGSASIVGLAILLILNAVSPEALVVRLNTDRAVATHKLDIGYLESLSSDSVPALIGASASLPVDLRPGVGTVCKAGRDYRPAWSAFNLSDLLAAAARRESCVPHGP